MRVRCVERAELVLFLFFFKKKTTTSAGYLQDDGHDISRILTADYVMMIFFEVDMLMRVFVALNKWRKVFDALDLCSWMIQVESGAGIR